MATYGMAYREVMGLPMRAFWHISGTVPRLQAEKHKVMLEIQMASQSQESFQQFHEAFAQAAPEPIKFKAEAYMRPVSQDTPEEGAFDILRGLAG